ncbi:MAG: bacillithiol biosynthesis cysteine-adding enzyme BshC [Tenacibaculum sp.]
MKNEHLRAIHIPFKNTGFFSKTMLDYLEQQTRIRAFYQNPPNFKGFAKQLKQKQASYNKTTRINLHKAISEQYTELNTTELSRVNMAKLLRINTFTITTGHQLNLFTGPLYFLYKIISTINLCEEMTKHFPDKNFVPVYWMATEDHDFDEVNFFNFNGKKVQWNSNQTGSVGRFITRGLNEVLAVFSEHLGSSKNAEYLKSLFYTAYVKHSNLADATRYLVNELFGHYGLLIIDPDKPELKRELMPYLEYELFYQTSYKEVSKTTSDLSKFYKIQVNPRQLNLFYLKDGLRERIILKNELYKVNNTDMCFSKKEIRKELDQFPERFSPNVIVRPLYQEIILPNLCYIGGGGELAYWLQLKAYFDAVSVPFPILMLRSSIQILPKKQEKKLKKLEISLEQLFAKQSNLIKLKLAENADFDIDFNEQKQFLKTQFAKLRLIAQKTDVSFIGAVDAQEKKQLKGLANLEKRLLRAEKRKKFDLVNRINSLQNEIFPNEVLEERQRNFSEYYLKYGTSFISNLKASINPLKPNFTVLVMD